MIPKKIFQTHQYKYDELPKWFKQTSDSWINLNPGWEYIYYDAEMRFKYVKEHSPELYKIYHDVVKPHQADIWRYLIVKNEGGVYADMDSFCTVPMDYILNGLTDHIDLVSTPTEKREHTNNANFAAVKNSKILTKCIEDIIDANHEKIKRNNPDQQIIHQCFSDGVMNNPDIVYKTMRAEHGYSYKTAFDQNIMMIDYYGKKMTYLDFLSNQNMI
jgi:hypothetical protein